MTWQCMDSRNVSRTTKSRPFTAKHTECKGLADGATIWRRPKAEPRRRLVPRQVQVLHRAGRAQLDADRALLVLYNLRCALARLGHAACRQHELRKHSNHLI